MPAKYARTSRPLPLYVSYSACICIACVQLHIAVFLFGPLTLPSFLLAHVLRESMGSQRRPGSWRRFTYSGSTAFASYGGRGGCEVRRTTWRWRSAGEHVEGPELKIANAIRSGGLIDWFKPQCQWPRTADADACLVSDPHDRWVFCFSFSLYYLNSNDSVDRHIFV